MATTKPAGDRGMSGAAGRRYVQAGQPLPYRVEGQIKDCHIGGHYIVRDANDTPVAYVAGRYDAQVFAASWDLLEALSELVHVVGGSLQGYGLLDAPMEKARAAIAKPTALRSGE